MWWKGAPRTQNPLIFGGLLDAPPETLSKLSGSVREFLEDLLAPAGRDRRRRAAEALVHADGPRNPIIAPAARPRWGRVRDVVAAVLEAACAPMQARAIHAAVEQLGGEPVSWSSVRNCLSADVRSRSPKFERVGHGRYRMAHDRQGEAPADR